VRPDRLRERETVLHRAFAAARESEPRRRGEEGEGGRCFEIAADSLGSDFGFGMQGGVRAVGAIRTATPCEQARGGRVWSSGFIAGFIDRLTARGEVSDLDRGVVVRADAEYGSACVRDVYDEMKERYQKEKLIYPSAFHWSRDPCEH
jgi:hypothetical protein